MEWPAARAEQLAANCASELQQQGFAVVPDLLTQSQLEELRMEAATLYEMALEGRACRSGSVEAGSVTARWDRSATQSCIYETLPGHCCTPELRSSYQAYREHRSRWPLRAVVWEVLFASQLTRLAAAILRELAPGASGAGPVLYNDQYILKPPGEPLSSFAWHRDSDWCRSEEVDYAPYISVWCALDDMTAANGCLAVLPGSQLPAPAGMVRRDLGEAPTQPPAALHDVQQQPQQLQQQGSAQVVALEVPAGTAVITSDTVLHCSGPNRSQHMRCAWMPQFSAAPLTWRAGGGCVSLAIPLQPPEPDV